MYFEKMKIMHDKITFQSIYIITLTTNMFWGPIMGHTLQVEKHNIVFPELVRS